MPSGSGSGIIHSVTFTPSVSGRVIVTASYEAVGTAGSAWGSSYRAHAFLTQNGSTTLGSFGGINKDVRMPGTVQGIFNVVAGAAVECGLWGQISGAVSAEFYNVKLVVEHIKR